MKILDYIRTLPTVLYKKDIFDRLTNLSSEYSNSVLPIYSQIKLDFKGHNFASREVKRFIPTFNALVKKRKNNFLETTSDAVVAASIVSEELFKIVEVKFSDATTRDTILYSQAQILQAISNLDFLADYSLRLANYVLVFETPNNAESINNYPKAEIEFIGRNFSAFCQIVNTLTDGASDYIKKLNQIKDVRVDEQNDDLIKATLGVAKTDPLSHGFINPTMNPFFIVGKIWTDFIMSRHEKNKEILELLQLRLLNLKKQQAESPDPSVEKEMSVVENRVNKLSAKIAKLEQEWGG